MEEQDEDKSEEIVILDEVEQPKKPEENMASNHSRILEEKLNDLKTYLSLRKFNQNVNGFAHTHFSLALVAKYARENISKEVENGGNWSPEETFNFGEYVISILALTGKTHFTLKNMADAYQRSTLIEDIKTGEAKSFLCHFYDEIKITDLVLSYFKSGYFSSNRQASKLFQIFPKKKPRMMKNHK